MRKKTMWRTVILVVLLVAIVYSVYSAATKDKRSVLQVGDEAPNFTLTDLQGAQHTLSDYKGKGVVINFWGTWCKPCKKEMPALDRQYKQFKDNGVTVLSINVAESTYAVENFVDRYNLTFPAAIDSKKSVMRAYNIDPLPTTILVDAQGKVTNMITGEMTEKDIAGYMKSIEPK